MYLSLSCSIKKSGFKWEDVIISAMFEINILLRRDTVRNEWDGITATCIRVNEQGQGMSKQNMSEKGKEQ